MHVNHPHTCRPCAWLVCGNRCKWHNGPAYPAPLQKRLWSHRPPHPAGEACQVQMSHIHHILGGSLSAPQMPAGACGQSCHWIAASIWKHTPRHMHWSHGLPSSDQRPAGGFKLVDDTMTWELCQVSGSDSKVQSIADATTGWSLNNGMALNAANTKEMVVNFSKQFPTADLATSN